MGTVLVHTVTGLKAVRSETGVSGEREREREFEPCHYETNFKCHRTRLLVSCLQEFGARVLKTKDTLTTGYLTSPGPSLQPIPYPSSKATLPHNTLITLSLNDSM